MRPWPVLIAAAAALAAGGAVVLTTNVGAPKDHYTHPPDPCAAVSEATVARLVGEPVEGRRSQPHGTSGWRPLQQGPDYLRCEWTPDPRGLAPLLTVDVENYYSGQFGAGRSGPDQAETGFRAVAGTNLCPELPPAGQVQVCGRDSPLSVIMRHENVVVHLSAIAPEQPPEDLGALVDDVVAALAVDPG